jgi:N-acetylmuramoyl-L-alanine amidase
VVLSRGPSTSPSPSERAAHANAERVEVIVSIHTNGHRSEVARGVSGHYFGNEAHASDRGATLAGLLVDGISEVTGTPHCRTHPSTTALLRESLAPAVTVEVGFLSHPEEGQALTDPAYQRTIATALVDGIVRFLVGASLVTS